MKLRLLTLILFAALTPAAFASDAPAPTSAEQGQASFSSSAPVEWPSAENFAADPRKTTLDVVDTILSNERIPATAGRPEPSGSN